MTNTTAIGFEKFVTGTRFRMTTNSRELAPLRIHELSRVPRAVAYSEQHKDKPSFPNFWQINQTLYFWILECILDQSTTSLSLAPCAVVPHQSRFWSVSYQLWKSQINQFKLTFNSNFKLIVYLLFLNMFLFAFIYEWTIKSV